MGLILSSNLLWQTLLYRRQGQALAYGTDHRDYWYRPLHAAISRAGLLSARGRDDDDYDLYCRILATYVDEDPCSLS